MVRPGGGDDGGRAVRAAPTLAEAWAGPAQAWGVTPEVVVLPDRPAAEAAVADLALSA